MNESKRNFKSVVGMLALSGMVFQNFAIAAPLTLAQRPLNSGKPPAPNLIVSIDDSGSMQTRTCYQPSTTYALPLDSSGNPIAVSFSNAPEDGWGTQYTATYDLNTTKEDGWCNSARRRYGAFPASSGRTLAQEQQNIAVWFSYYRDRMNKVKSSMTRAFAPSVLGDNTVRLGFQTLNSCANWGTGCKPDSKRSTTYENRLRVLDSTRRNEFWRFLTSVGPWSSTPLRPTMTRVGEYYSTTGLNGPMASVPGSAESPVLSCRRNFHVLLTDGQWNGGDGLITKDLSNSTFSLPDGASYSARVPYKGSSGAAETNLADIALHYWKTDLQPALANDLTPLVRSPGTSNATGTPIPEYWNPVNNPATWQHMVNFTIGVDLSESLQAGSSYPEWGGSTYASNPNGYAAILNGSRNWPNMNTFDDRAYDLWRAAINSRGAFYSADDPASVEQAFRAIIQQILSSGSQGQTVGGAGPRIGTEGAAYLGNYGADLSGTLAKKSINADGSLAAAPIWEAGSLLLNRTPASRTILSHSGAGAIAFQWGNLSTSQKAALNAVGNVTDGRGADRVEWMRGDRSKELGSSSVTDPTKALRARSKATLLGSIVNSTPVAVGANSAGISGDTYKSFLVDTIRKRPPVVYVGANDGMLHGFKESDGSELVAYVPKGVYENLSNLTSTDFTSQYYVNGSPFIADAYAGGKWRTLLVGTMAGGGKGLFMLDASNPTAYSEGNPSATVLLDLAGSDDADLGNIMGQSPIGENTAQSLLVTKLPNNKTVLVVGNGVNSTNEKPVLFVFHLDKLPSGAWTLGTNYFKVEPSGSGVAGSNGLALPIPADTDRDGVTDTLYAGDLKGNLWKFEYDAASASGFKVGNGGAPLFTAPMSGSKPQPMTSSPEVMIHPKGGVMVVQGTGQLMQDSDANNTQVQTVYGIWDKPNSTGSVVLANLVQQTITGSFSSLGKEFRKLSSNKVDYATKRGWYVNLVSNGERVVAGPQLLGKSVLVPTVIPESANGETCSPGVSPGWWMGFDGLTGGSTELPYFDTNGDRKVSKSDAVANGVKVLNGEAKPYIGKTNKAPPASNSLDPFVRCESSSRSVTGAAGESMTVGATGRCGRIGWTQIKN